jgi:hypothetical protein
MDLVVTKIETTENSKRRILIWAQVFLLPIIIGCLLRFLKKKKKAVC